MHSSLARKTTSCVPNAVIITSMNIRATAFKTGLEDNAVLYYMYLGSLPVARLLATLKFSANLVTGLSFVAASMSCVALLYERSGYFVLFWLSSILLDLCDGMVARLTGTEYSEGFDVDSFADVLKIVMILMTLEYLADELDISVMTTFLVGSMLAHRVVNSKTSRSGDRSLGRKANQGVGSRVGGATRPKGVRSFVLVPIGTFNAHSLVLLALPGLIHSTSRPIYGYLTVVIIVQVLRSISASKMNRRHRTSACD